MCARLFASDASLALQRGLRHILRSRRGKACPLLNRLRNILAPLQQQFVAPVLELPSDGFDAAGLFDGGNSDPSDVVVAHARFRRLQDGISCGRVDAFAEFV
jgi:hypothetical protein